MEELFTLNNLTAFVTLAALEIVLGIDNVVFIAILTGKLDPSVRDKARRIGLLAAMGMRILLLLGISWVIGLTATLFTAFGINFSGKDLIMLVGGLFLLAKATYEIHDKLEAAHSPADTAAARARSFGTAIVQIMAVDLVFSLDSVITAVGMAQRIEVMIAAVIAAVGVMMAFANPVSGFVERHPTMKMLALAFLLLIGVMLVAEGFHQHISKGYIYFAMAFSLGVELLNLLMRKRAPITLHHSHLPSEAK